MSTDLPIPLPNQPQQPRAPDEASQPEPVPAPPADSDFAPPDVELLPVVEEPQPPHPGFFTGLLWCIGFDLFLYGTLIAIFLLTLLGRMAVSSDPKAFMSTLAPQGKPSDELSLLIAPAVLISEIGSIIVAWLVVRFVVGPEWKRRLSMQLPGLTQLVLVLLAFPGFLFLPNLVFYYARLVLPNFGDASKTAEVFGSWPLWLGVLAVGVGPGIGEELWCRGFLGRGLIGRYGIFPGVLLTSLLFGLMHVDPPLVVATAVMGIWLHYVYLMSRSLPLSMLLHCLNNSTVVLMTKYPKFPGGDEQDPTGPSAILLYAGSALLIATVAWALYQCRARVIGNSAGEPAYPNVEEPPPDSDALVLRPWPDVFSCALVVVGVLVFAASYALAVMV
jgi:membrane protease YdiL (CAAX protease family)